MKVLQKSNKVGGDMDLFDLLAEATQNPKLAAAVAGTSIVSGSFLDKFPEQDLAKIATLLGIVLTCLLIVIHGIKLSTMLIKRFKSWRTAGLSPDVCETSQAPQQAGRSMLIVLVILLTIALVVAVLN